MLVVDETLGGNCSGEGMSPSPSATKKVFGQLSGMLDDF